jgi:NAD(P)-dependent dehydrogenase (short-subunit alcohol dehydrogenase family)
MLAREHPQLSCCKTYGDLLSLSADIATDEGRAAVAAAVGPRLRALVHSAGAYMHEPIDAGSAPAWAALDAVNLHAPILLTLACRSSLKAGSGHVVFVNSTAGLQPGANTAYSAGKHALRAAANSLRQDVNRDGILVTSIFPGRTDTPMQETILAQEGRVAQPGMLLRPEDVAAMIMSALTLPRSAEVTEIVIRPAQPLPG